MGRARSYRTRLTARFSLRGTRVGKPSDLQKHGLITENAEQLVLRRDGKEIFPERNCTSKDVAV